MDVTFTKISQNGQIVIPSSVRQKMGITPATKFLVSVNEGDILLKQINEESLFEDMGLINKINNSEEQIRKGNFVKCNSSMSEKEMDEFLMK